MAIHQLLRGKGKLGPVTVGSGGTLIKKIKSATVSVDPANATAGAEVTVDVTVTGVAAGDLVFPTSIPALEVGLVLKGIKVQSTDTIRFVFLNTTVGAINGAALN